MIEREGYLNKIVQAFKTHNIVCLLGPRQCGKTTLARALWAQSPVATQALRYFDLENPVDVQRLDNPELALRSLTGLIVIDEVQRRPNLFPFLRYLHDENLPQQYLILGSASRALLNQAAESLAGRIAFIEITPFNLAEVAELPALWHKGGFPKSYLLAEALSYEWRMHYVRTYIEQDLQTFGLNFDPHLLRKMWFMLAHYHGQIFNASEIATALGVSAPTIKRYLGYLEATFMVRLLTPWFANLKKRQVKSHKLYLRDSGLLHYFLGIKTFAELALHPKIGASWEGFALEQVCRALAVDSQDCFFWASHNAAELDLLVLAAGKKQGFEFKYQDAPKLSAAMKIALEDLQLDSLTVIYPGQKPYQLHDKVKVVGLVDFCQQVLGT